MPAGYTWYAGTDRAASPEELEVLRLTNEIRARGVTCQGVAQPPAPPLVWNDRLAHAARNHSQDMAVRQFFDHHTPDSFGPAERVAGTGYLDGARAWGVGENIAAGQPTPAEAVAGWLSSATGHCEALMNPKFRELGVGFFRDTPDDEYVTYWTQDFAVKE